MCEAEKHAAMYVGHEAEEDNTNEEEEEGEDTTVVEDDEDDVEAYAEYGDEEHIQGCMCGRSPHMHCTCGPSPHI